MKALLYKVLVNPGAVIAHSCFEHQIWELWLPEFNVCVNASAGMFRSDKPRVDEKDTKEIEIPRSDACLFKEAVDATEDAQVVRKNLFDKLTEKGLTPEIKRGWIVEDGKVTVASTSDKPIVVDMEENQEA